MCMLQIEEFYRASNFSEFLKHYKEIWISKFEQMCLKNNASYHLKRLNWQNKTAVLHTFINSFMTEAVII